MNSPDPFMEDEANNPEGESRRPVFRILALLVLAALPFLVYGNSLESPFVRDDLGYIKNSPHVINFSFPESLGDLRCLNKFSYWINRQIHGLSMPGYHLVNISLHALVGMLVFFLFRLLLERFSSSHGSRDKPCAALLAFAGALLYELHPIHTQAVNYTFARSELLCAVFIFSAFLVHARKEGARYGYGRAIAVSAFLLLALASKERAFMFIPALLLFDLLVRREEGKAVRYRRWQKLVIPLSIVIILGLINFYSGFTRQHTGGFAVGEEVPEFIPYFLTEIVVRLKYLMLYFWPPGLSFDHHFVIRDSLGDPVLLAALGFHILLLGLALFISRRRGLIAFGIFWFFLFIAPTSGLVPATLLMHEHWTYLPSFGIFLVVLVLVQQGYAAWKSCGAALPLPWALTAVFLLLFLFLGYSTFRRNEVWYDHLSLWQDAIRHSPESPWVWNNLGMAYLEAREYEKALTHLEESEKVLGESHAASCLNIGICFMELGNNAMALERLNQAYALNPERPEILIALGQLHKRMGNHALSLQCFAALGRLGRFLPTLFLEMAEVALDQGDPEMAKKHLEEGLLMFPKNQEIQKMLQQIQK